MVEWAGRTGAGGAGLRKACSNMAAYKETSYAAMAGVHLWVACLGLGPEAGDGRGGGLRLGTEAGWSWLGA